MAHPLPEISTTESRRPCCEADEHLLGLSIGGTGRMARVRVLRPSGTLVAEMTVCPQHSTVWESPLAIRGPLEIAISGDDCVVTPWIADPHSPSR